MLFTPLFFGGAFLIHASLEKKKHIEIYEKSSRCCTRQSVGWERDRGEDEKFKGSAACVVE